MLHNKAKALNLVKAAMIALLFFSCMPSTKADEVDTLIQKLKDKDSGVRWSAVYALRATKDTRAVEPLIAALKEDPNVRAAWALGVIKDARAVEPLIAALKDKDSDVLWKAVAGEALGRIGAPAVEPLIAALKDKDSSVRRGAAWALGVIKDARPVEPLIAALKDKDSSVRWHAAEALGVIKDARAVEPLIAAVKDKDSDIRLAAVAALGEIKDARAVEALIAAKADEIHSFVAQKDGDALKKWWNTTKAVLLKDVESNDYGIIENTLYAFIGIGKEEIIPELIEKLHGKGMAEAYLNCGHPKLAEAAKDWAWRHGYSISTGSGNAPVGWGRW